MPPVPPPAPPPLLLALSPTPLALLLPPLLPPCTLQTESYWGNVNPIGERSCYDEGKRAAECLTMDYHREHGQEVRG